MTEYKTCTHIHDTGYFCQSAAVTGRDYCCYHLRYRGRLMRMAQSRARSQRFDLRLPPLENMHAVQSALSQLMEALAADMIDPKRAHEIHSILRTAANNFKHPNAWTTSAYINDQSAPYPNSYEEFEAEFGLPENLDLNAPPEVAFPPPASDVVNEAVGCPTPAGFAGVGIFGGGARVPIPPSFDRAPLFPDIPAPYVRDYTAEAEAAFESTPEDIELTEILYRRAGLQGLGPSRPRAPAQPGSPQAAQALPRQLRALRRRSQAQEHPTRRRKTAQKAGRRKARSRADAKRRAVRRQKATHVRGTDALNQGRRRSKRPPKSLRQRWIAVTSNRINKMRKFTANSMKTKEA